MALNTPEDTRGSETQAGTLQKLPRYALELHPQGP